MTLKVVRDEEGNVAPPPAHTIPSPHYLLLDKARLAYWKAVIKGNPKKIASTLKDWATLLHVPKTRVTNGS